MLVVEYSRLVHSDDVIDILHNNFQTTLLLFLESKKLLLQRKTSNSFQVRPKFTLQLSVKDTTLVFL